MLSLSVCDTTKKFLHLLWVHKASAEFCIGNRKPGESVCSASSCSSLFLFRLFSCAALSFWCFRPPKIRRLILRGTASVSQWTCSLRCYSIPDMKLSLCAEILITARDMLVTGKKRELCAIKTFTARDIRNERRWAIILNVINIIYICIITTLTSGASHLCY